MTIDPRVRIDCLVAGGDGLAREPGRPVTFVTGAAPGDLVAVRVESESAQYRRASVAEVIEPGPGRREPPCPEAGACGGCPWMHLTDAAQAEAATSILEAALRRAGARVAPGALRPAVPAALPLGYRQRMRVHLELGTAPRSGFLRRASHDVHAIERCLALDPRLERVRAAIDAALPQLAAALGPCRAELQVDLPGGTGAALLRADAPAAGARDALALLQQAAPALTSLAARDQRHRLLATLGDDTVTFRRGPQEEPQRWPAFLAPGGFLQASASGNALLVSRVLDAARTAGLARGARVLELFAGSGNFTLPLAGLGLDVEAGDDDAGAIAAATRAVTSCAAELATPPRFHALSAAAHVARCAREGRTFDAVALDPPRTGAKDVVAKLAGMAPLIVYVSCDAPTLARDAAMLGRAGFAVISAEPLLLFPQSSHFETVAVLRRQEAVP